MAKCNSCVHFYVCEKYDATVDFDVDDGVCLYYEKKVVLCKDCKYYDMKNEDCDHPVLWFEYCSDCGLSMKPYDFCSYGERREGE